jgi:hypothetical protein
VILLRKQISDFNISSDVTKGTSKQLVICPECNHYNVVINNHKLTYQKIKTIICSKCNRAIKIGDIFNFTSGSKLNNRNIKYDVNYLDTYIWDNDYDKI